MWALKVAAVRYNPEQGTKFITLAYPVVWFALIDFCRVESARGMHVPTNHEPHFAKAMVSIRETWHHPRAAYLEGVNELGEDFWRSVTRGLTDREREVILGVFRDGKTQKVVGREIGISKQRAGQLYLQAMEKLRRRDDLKELARAA